MTDRNISVDITRPSPRIETAFSAPPQSGFSINSLLAGFVAAVGAVTSADSILSAIQKLWGNSNTSTALTLTGNATTIDAGAGSGRKYRLTTTTTAGITITISGLPTGSGEWEAELLLTTTAVPASITWQGPAVVFMDGLGLGDFPLVAGRLTRIGFSKQGPGRVTAMAWKPEVLA